MTHNWHDYQFHEGQSEDSVAASVTHLRIGFIQYQELHERNTPAPIIELADYAIFEHPNLKQVQIYLPVVSRIGNSAFKDCDQLKAVEFVMKPPREEGDDNSPPSQLISIGNDAFQGCNNLHSLIGLEHAKASLQEIGEDAFLQCNVIANVDFLPSLERLQSLGDGTFYQNHALITADLSKAAHLTYLQGFTFGECTALTSVRLPPNLLQIGQRAFFRCSALEQIILPSTLEHIDDDVFDDCCQLKSIVLPSISTKNWLALLRRL